MSFWRFPFYEQTPQGEPEAPSQWSLARFKDSGGVVAAFEPTMAPSKLTVENLFQRCSVRAHATHRTNDRVTIVTVNRAQIAPAGVFTDEHGVTVPATWRVDNVLTMVGWVRRAEADDPQTNRIGDKKIYVQVPTPDHLLVPGEDGRALYVDELLGCFGDVVTAYYGQYQHAFEEVEVPSQCSSPVTPRSPSPKRIRNSW